jgi:hypothetical protein
MAKEAGRFIAKVLFFLLFVLVFASMLLAVLFPGAVFTWLVPPIFIIGVFIWIYIQKKYGPDFQISSTDLAKPVDPKFMPPISLQRDERVLLFFPEVNVAFTSFASYTYQTTPKKLVVTNHRLILTYNYFGASESFAGGVQYYYSKDFFETNKALVNHFLIKKIIQKKDCIKLVYKTFWENEVLVYTADTDLLVQTIRSFVEVIRLEKN